MERKSKRRSGGYSLLELTISMGIAALLATGFFQTFRVVGNALEEERDLSLHENTLQEALFQMARDIRLTGANPTANLSLFDGTPSTDVALDLDPDLDGDLSNAILVRADKRGTTQNVADGDTADNLEVVIYSWDKPNARLIRKAWRVPVSQSGMEQEGYESSSFLEGICSFSMKYLDGLGNSTTDANQVSEIVVDLTSSTGPGNCYKPESYTRASHASIRLRNR